MGSLYEGNRNIHISMISIAAITQIIALRLWSRRKQPNNLIVDKASTEEEALTATTKMNIQETHMVDHQGDCG